MKSSGFYVDPIFVYKQNHRKTKKSRKTAGLLILKRVTSGTRTHDIQNHNLTL